MVANGLFILINNFFLLILTVLISCKTNLIDKTNESNKEVIQEEIVKTKEPILRSGRYGELSIAVDHSLKVTGVYEYYGGWDDKYNEFMQVNTFYFTGIARGKFVHIKTAWPTSDQVIDGEIEILNDSLRFTLRDIPDGYATVNFTSGFVRSLDKISKWEQIRIIKLQRARLFNTPDSLDPRKGYLIANDIVKIVSIRNDNWMEIEYSKKGQSDKYINGWIHKDSLFDTNPEKW